LIWIFEIGNQRLFGSRAMMIETEGKQWLLSCLFG